MSGRDLSRTGPETRVLHIISPTGFYGAERWVLDVMRHSDATGVHSQLAVTSESEGERIELEERVREIGKTVHRIDLRHRFDLDARLQLRRLIATQNIDVVHSHGYKSDLIAWMAVRSGRGRSVLMSTPHGYGVGSSLKMRAFVSLGKRILRRFDAVVPLSPALLEEVISTGVSAEHVTLIMNGTDIDEIESVERLGERPVKEGGQVLGYVGQLIPRKRVGTLIDVFDRMAAVRPHLRLVIAGDGPSRSALQDRAAASPHASRIEFLGFVADRLRLMRTFDAFVLSSAHEGIPRCAMEAMGLGIPVAAWSIPGVSELVENGVSGLLAADGDLDALHECCERLIDDEAFANAVGSRARDLIRGQFSVRRMASEYAALYRSLVEEVRSERSVA